MSRSTTASNASHDARRWRASLVLMLVSGFAGLGYQIVWTQQSAVWLGHESAAVLAVVAAFFGGIAVGALSMGPLVERSTHPARWYAGCEFVIAAWSVALIPLLPLAGEASLAVIGVEPSAAWQWTVAFVGTFALLLPATAAMGASLPAIERATSSMRVGRRSIAAHYASNTFGAVLGVLLAAFWLVPAVGLSRTALLCGTLNLACGAASLGLWRGAAEVPKPVAIPDASLRRRTLAALAWTGLLGIGYEVLVVRVLSQVDEDTVYTFAMLIAVYLVGTAIGATGYQRWRVRFEDRRLDDLLPCGLAVACLGGTASLWFAEQISSGWLDAFGERMTTALAAEGLLALLAFGLPTIAMGALFSHLCARANRAGISFGRALGVNAVAAAGAPLVFGVLMAPLVGAKGSLLAIVAGYLALVTRRRIVPGAWAIAALVAAVAIWAPPLRFVDIPDGGHLVSYAEGASAAVSVVEDDDGVARLRINNRQQEGSSATRQVDARQALLPLLLHPAPQRALFLGLGTGVTASSAAEDPQVEVDAVELLPEVIAASRYFTRAFDDGVPNPRLHPIPADARRYVRATSRRYDVIVSDNFHPARSGSGALYTIEHFRAVRERLAPGGLFCQWLPLHQLDLESLRSIVQSFVAVYPGGRALLASNSLETPVLGLVGGSDQGFDVAAARHRLATSGMRSPPASFGIDDDLALFGTFVAGPQALARFAGRSPANVDDHPVVAYRAPRITYEPDSLPRDRLMTLLAQWSMDPDELVDPSTDAGWKRRLAAYWRARDRFVDAGRNVHPSADVRRMLSQVREPLLTVLRISPDFRPAYDPLLRMAFALGRSDEPAARALLIELASIQPARLDADIALRALDATAP